MDKPKSRVDIIIAKMGKKKPDEDEEDSGKEGLRAAMRDFLKAVESKDLDGMVEAFCSAQDQHSEGGYDDKDEEESKDDEESEED